MNPLWAKHRKDYENSWRLNEKAAAWLCDPSKWTKYCDEDKANYAIGGPSIEMYVRSYNQAYSVVNDIVNDNTKYPLGAIYKEDKIGYIYTINGQQSTLLNSNDNCTGNNSLNYTKYNGMYCEKKEGLYKMWIASPSAVWYDNLCCLYTDHEYLGYNNPAFEARVSPIISLKSGFIPEVE